MVYDLPGVQIHCPIELTSFQTFSSRGQSGSPVLGLHPATALPLAEKPLFTAHHKEMDVTATSDGWQFSLPQAPTCWVRLSKDRRQIHTAPMEKPWQQAAMLPLLRTAIECASAMEHVLSLHSACVVKDGEAICFTAPSGTGKSTRAIQWVQALDAIFLSGDRPSLKVTKDAVTACGVPWDGKEQIYRNAQYPLKMICLITRGDPVRARKLPGPQARQILMQQTFLPMWDTEAAVAVMTSLRTLLDRVPVVQLQCGPDAAAAREAYDLLYHHPERIEEETP